MPPGQPTAANAGLVSSHEKLPCSGYSDQRADICGPASLALSPECWPPACGFDMNCDQCDMLKTQRPNRRDFFLVPPRPRFYIESDGAAIRRFPGKSYDFASLGPIPAGTVAPTNIVLSTGNFNYDFRAAGRALIGFTINECFQIEGVYSGVSESRNAAAVRDANPNGFGSLTGDLFSPFGNFGADPIGNLDYNNFAWIRYVSSLQSVELNVRRNLPMVPDRLSASILFGVRYFGLPEEFDYATESDVAFTPEPAAGAVSNAIHVATDNQMIGPQIGARFEVYIENRWWVNFEMKAAVMNNRAVQSTSYANTVNGTEVEAFGSAREDHTAFAGELALTFLYRWSPNITTRIGYQALWLEGVALAPDNLSADLDILRLGPAQLNHSCSTLYHGPFAGITIGW